MNAINTKYTETEENWIKTISIENVDFIDTNLLTSAIWNAYKLISWNRKLKNAWMRICMEEHGKK